MRDETGTGRVDVDDADLRTRVADLTGTTVEAATDLDGGEVGRVRRLDLADGRALVAKTGPTPLSVEGRMLRYLADHTDLPVPTVHHAADDLLLLAFVPGGGTVTASVERDAAERLAALHGATAEAYGFPFDTLSGRLAQPNPWTGSWVEFFREHRLLHVARAGRESGRLPADLHDRVRALAGNLDALLVEPAAPALVHGDVWRGNLVVRDGAVAAFLDPACYYGHREVELAYVEWTGTFGSAFRERYRELRPPADGAAVRRPVYELLPVLEHVEHFGASYLPAVRERLDALGY
jgi:fructosamine-3-kinase